VLRATRAGSLNLTFHVRLYSLLFLKINHNLIVAVPSRERTACFKREDEVPGRMVDRFKFCPDGRVLWPTEDAPK
jgi:hypothetical protein